MGLGLATIFLLAANSVSAADTLPDRATNAFNQGLYQEAAEFMKEAYGQDPQPLYLFNIGRAYQEAGQWLEAKAYFERYLLTKPPMEQRVKAEKQLANVVAQLPQPPQKIASPPPPGPRRPKAPWLLAGAGALSAGAGGVFVYLANNRRESVREAARNESGAVSGMSQERAYTLREEADTLALTGGVLAGVGATAMAAGTVWAILSWENSTPSSTLDIRPENSGVNIIWTTPF